MKIQKQLAWASMTFAAMISLTGCSVAITQPNHRNASINITNGERSKTTNVSQASDGRNTTSFSDTSLSTQNSFVPLLTWFRMVNSNVGWATASHGGVWATTNGGIKWNDVTPKTISTYANVTVRIFGLNAKQAWGAVTSNGGIDKPVAIYHTSDGGKSWRKQRFSDVGDPITLRFRTANNGWIALFQGAAAGSESETIYHTSNRGTTWNKVGMVNYHGGSLPFAGDKTGASFLDPLHGWATGYPVNNKMFLYRTIDGGKTWTSQALSIPSNKLHQTYFVTYPPVFFNQRDGVLPTWVDTTQGTFLVFYTTDGGGTWKPTTTITRNVKNVESRDWSFPSRTDWFVTDNQHLFVTHNSGQTWNTITPNISFTNVTRLDFTSSSDGWVLMSPGELYHTKDGGHTWSKR